MKRAYFFVAMTAALCACAKSGEPEQGSQTHFLTSCDQSCAAPYECLCGVCTLPCSSDTRCEAQAEQAACVAPASGDACDGHAMVCDVECTNDGQCEALSALHTCEAGRCRERSMSDAGGGVGGVGGGGTGGGGTGGMGGAGGSDAGPVLGSICDGSSEMRLGLTSEGGFVEQTYEFTNPFGHSFFFMDGQCRYYASVDYRDGIFTGTLSGAAEQQLMSDIAWAMITELAAVPEVESCPDAGETSIWAPGYRASCTCGCDESALKAEKEAAINAIYPLIQSLTTEGDQSDPLTTAILGVAQEVGPATGSEPMWPLDRAVTDIAGFVKDVSAGGSINPVRFDDADEAAALRALRATVTDGIQLQVQDNGVAYFILLRDAFPDGVEAAIRALRQSSGSTESLPNPDEEALKTCEASEPCPKGLAQLVENSSHHIQSVQCVIDALAQRTPGRYQHDTDSTFSNGSAGAHHTLIVKDDGTALYSRVPYAYFFETPPSYGETEPGQRCVLRPASYFEGCSAALADTSSAEAWSCAFGDGTATTASQLDWFESCEEESPIACE